MWKLSTFFKILIIVGLAAVVGACDRQMTQDSFGLDHVIALDISSEDLAVMQHGTYSKSKVSVSMQINGEFRQGAIAVAGATSVDDYKKSYEIELDEPYLGKTVFRLNAMSRDPSAMHALTAYYTFNLTGVQTPFLEPIAVWINDEYAGLYLFQEKYDHDYFSSQAQSPASLYQAENSVAGMDTSSNYDVAFSVKIGDHEMVDLKHMLKAVRDFSEDGDEEKLSETVDIPSLINYMAVTSYINHVDGIVNNYYLVRLSNSAQFTILPWDLDYSFGNIHSADDSEMLHRNLLMSSILKKGSSTSITYESRFEQVAKAADAKTLGAFVDELQGYVAEAYNADPVLSKQERSLDEFASNLKSQFQEMEKAAAVKLSPTIVAE